MRDVLGRHGGDDDAEVVHEESRAPGKVSLTGRLAARSARAAAEPHPLAVPFAAPVQMLAGGTQLDDPFAVHQTAARGVSGSAQPLPHQAAIQRSFGHHDVSGVRAHVGGAAADAADAIGASAYATGDDVAFAAPPDLRQAAHETAHVVQQRGGVRLDGGIGRSGDRYERHADAVADLVVRGESAEALLDTMAHRGAAGGPAVQREDRDGDGVEDTPSTERWERGPDGRLTDAAVERLRRRTIEATAIGTHGARGTLSEPEAGSFENQRSWSDARINRALRLLADLDHGTDTNRRGRPVRGRRGGTDRPVLAWESHKDDLGLPDRTRGDRSREYQNMLEFVDRLDSLSESTMGLEYNPEYGTGGMDAMPTIRLAGAAVGVHPRALYFTAAAQLGMDERAGRAEGGGHFIPAGGFRVLLTDIAGMASRIGTERTRGRRRRGTPARSDRTGSFENGGAIYNALRRELDLCLRVLEDQANETDTVTGYHHTEHREPVLREFIVARAERIRALPASATDENAAEAARQLAAVLDGLPGATTRSHGAGSIDPHGTEHAMGVAIDIYNGAGEGGGQRNFAPPEEYWPFIHRLIERHGPSVGLPTTLRPDSWNDLDGPDRTEDQATQARAIATLVRVHGQAEADAIEAEAAPDPAAARADHATASRFSGLRNRARRALIDRRRVLTRASRSRGLDRRMADDVQAELDNLDADLEVIQGTNHHDLVPMLQRHHQALMRLENHEETIPTEGPPPPEPEPRGGRRRRPPADPLTDVGPDDAAGTRADLSPIIADLQAMGDSVDAAVTRDATSDLSELVRTRAFERWLTTASDIDTPLYDQPTTMVDAFNDVEGTHFYGGHHWEISPVGESHGAERSILEDEGGPGGTGNYAETLNRDMARRTPEQLERILGIMAESEGGRRAIFGNAELVPAGAAAADDAGPTSTTDAEGAPSSVPDASSSSSSSSSSSGDAAASVPAEPVPAGADPTLREAFASHLPNLDEVLARVHARVVAPYEGATGESAAMLRDLRDRGIYVTPATD